MQLADVPAAREDDMKPLTKTQKAVLDFIERHIEKYGYPPVLREICMAFGYRSPNGATCHLRALERKGHIKRSYGKARAIELTDRQAGIPLGSVT
jgi:repressor LexA